MSTKRAKLFRWAAVILILVHPAAAQGPHDPLIIISSTVFVGNDADIPLEAGYVIAIQPRMSADGEILVPNSIYDALIEMHRALPHWYLVALSRAPPDNECSVIVNNHGYSTSISVWMLLNWVKEDTPIWNEFESLGWNTVDWLPIQQAFVHGLCGLVHSRTREQIMGRIAEYAKLGIEN